MLSLCVVMGGYYLLEVPFDTPYEEAVIRAQSGVLIVVTGGILMMVSIGMRTK